VTEETKSGSPRRHRGRGVIRIVLSALCVSAVNLSVLHAGAVERVASLNLCTDQMLVLLAPEKVVGLSQLARDPAISFVAAQAAHLPVVRASAEAVLRLHPDLILAGPYGAQTTLALLRQERAPLLRIDLPQDFAGIRQMTRLLATKLGVPERGEALIAAMDADLDGVPHRHDGERAVVWEPRGLTAGPGTLMDAILQAAGLSNSSDGRRLSLEAMVRNPPQLLIVPTAPAYPSLATTLLEHPAIAKVPRREIPPTLTICAGPFTAQAPALLAR
jgi:iron complex transport system substrate-binding protein